MLCVELLDKTFNLNSPIWWKQAPRKSAHLFLSSQGLLYLLHLPAFLKKTGGGRQMIVLPLGHLSAQEDKNASQSTARLRNAFQTLFDCVRRAAPLPFRAQSIEILCMRLARIWSIPEVILETELTVQIHKLQPWDMIWWNLECVLLLPCTWMMFLTKLFNFQWNGM